MKYLMSLSVPLLFLSNLAYSQEVLRKEDSISRSPLFPNKGAECDDYSFSFKMVDGLAYLTIYNSTKILKSATIGNPLTFRLGLKNCQVDVVIKPVD